MSSSSFQRALPMVSQSSQKQPSFPIESTYDATRRYLRNLRHLHEIKTFSKNSPKNLAVSQKTLIFAQKF